MYSFLIVLVFIILSVFFVYFLLKNDKGTKEPVLALWAAAAFGVIGIVIAIILESKFIPGNLLNNTGISTKLFSKTMTVGLIEESCKFIPLAIFIFKRKFFNEHTDGIIYFAIAGLAFGLPENILYTLTYGTRIGLTRIILDTVFHASLTGMVGYFLANYKVENKSPFKVIPFLIGAIIIHGLYDFGLLSGNILLETASIIITLSLGVGLFYFYIKASDMDQAEGLAVVGHNSFCRTCGKPNPKHYLYCVSCGVRA